MKADLFQSCGHCWVFQMCWHIECSMFTASSFRIWNSSTGIPSPPLALFIVMLSRAYLTSHSRMSGSRWVVMPSWLSGSWRSFFCSSSVYSWPPLLNIFCFCSVHTDQDHSHGKEMQKGKMVEEALQIDVKRREVKSKGEKQRYSHLNAEFQRIARRDKKAFLSDQCKAIEENNSMGKTRDLFKKIWDIKGTFQAKMGLIKDRNGMAHNMCNIKCQWLNGWMNSHSI